MTNKPKTTTKRKAASKPTERPEPPFGRWSEAVAVESKEKLKAIYGVPNPSSVFNAFNMIFEKQFLNVGEYSKMKDAEKRRLQSYNDYLEMVQNDFAVPLSKIDDADLVREIIEAVAGIKCFSAALGGCNIEGMPEYVAAEFKAAEGKSLNKAKQEKHPETKIRRNLIREKYPIEEIKKHEEHLYKFAQSIKPEMDAELLKLGFDPVSEWAYKRDLAGILSERSER
jgi:hypothetical protein